MQRIGIRELKARASEVLRQVREERVTYEITLRGQAIAHIVPALEEPGAPETPAGWLAALDRLTADIASTWPEGVGADDAIDDVRRSL